MCIIGLFKIFESNEILAKALQKKTLPQARVNFEQREATKFRTISITEARRSKPRMAFNAWRPSGQKRATRARIPHLWYLRVAGSVNYQLVASMKRRARVCARKKRITMPYPSWSWFSAERVRRNIRHERMSSHQRFVDDKVDYLSTKLRFMKDLFCNI